MLISSEVIEGYWQNVEHHHATSLFPDFEIHHDMEVFNGWVYPSRDGLSPVAHRPGFGWSDLHVAIVQDKMHAPEYKNSNPILIDRKYAAVISFPGGYTFGHWIIDISTRLYQCLKYFDRKDLCFLLPKPLPSWAKPFLDAFDVTSSDFIEVGEFDRYRAANLLLPSLYRVTDFLPTEPHRSAFNVLRNAVPLPTGGPHHFASRILVEHTPQSSVGHRPTLKNFDQVKETLAAIGFTTIRPAELTYNEQAALFRNAKIIVGEDSSALHNIVHSINTETYLVVLSGDRINMLHSALSRVLNIHCDYIDCYNDSGNFFCHLDGLISCINRII